MSGYVLEEVLEISSVEENGSFLKITTTYSSKSSQYSKKLLRISLFDEAQPDPFGYALVSNKTHHKLDLNVTVDSELDVAQLELKIKSGSKISISEVEVPSKLNFSSLGKGKRLFFFASELSGLLALQLLDDYMFYCNFDEIIFIHSISNTFKQAYQYPVKKVFNRLARELAPAGFSVSYLSIVCPSNVDINCHLSRFLYQNKFYSEQGIVQLNHIHDKAVVLGNRIMVENISEELGFLGFLSILDAPEQADYLEWIVEK